jgi:hypothetical protein
MHGCNHRHIWDARKIATDVIESRFDLASGSRQDFYVCPKCAAPRENGVTDFCMESVLHRIETARKLTPIDKKRMVLF